MNFIVERQTGDWSNNNDEDAVARFAQGSIEKKQLTLSLIDLWNSCFRIRFTECRENLRTIAHKSWRQASDCHGIFDQDRYREVSHRVFGATDCWILFTDDDDWFSPQVFQTLRMRLSLAEQRAVLWQRIRFDGELLITPINPSPPAPLYVYTNNYAVNAQLIPNGQNVGEVMSHGYADLMLKTGKWHFFFLDAQDSLSVTNKTPCSWNYLKRARDMSEPKSVLIQQVEHYVYSIPKISPNLEWTVPYIESAQAFFQDVLNHKKV